MTWQICCMLFAVGIVLGGCDSTTTEDADELAVVEAFIFAGEPVDDIRVTTTIPLSSTDSIGAPINDAQIQLTRDGVVYPLTARGSDGLYYYAGTDLRVAPGDAFLFEMAYQGETAYGETVVPPSPVDVVLDTTVFDVPNFDIGRPPAGGPRDYLLLVTWGNENDDLHYVVIESVDENPESIFPDFIGQRLNERFRFISEPTRDSFFEINLLLLEGLGEHQIKVYRVNQEYADLYDNREQDSRDLNQPPDNIIGALGVFSAFNSVTEFFDVKREE